MHWMTVVLPPKGGGNYCGISLLEHFWKAIEIIINKQRKVVKFHDSLYKLQGGRGANTATIEANLAYLEYSSSMGYF